MLLLVNTYPAVPAAVVAKTLVVEAYVTPYCVNAELCPVPPLVFGSVPLTSAVKDTAPKVGAPLAFPCRTVVAVPAAVVARTVVDEA